MKAQASFSNKSNNVQKQPYQMANTIISKNNNFSNQKKKENSKVSTQLKIIKSFKKIGKCLNQINHNDMPADGYHKVCLILINNFNSKNLDIQDDEMNNGYLIGVYQYRLGFKVFYLYNSDQENYPKYLQFFLNHTTEALTIFYSNYDSTSNQCEDNEFKDEDIVKMLNNIISHENNGKCKTVIISDCATSHTVFDLCSIRKLNYPNPPQIISFSVIKQLESDLKKEKKSCEIFTYYFCKFIYECPDITPKRLVERMNSVIKRFKQTFICETTNSKLENEPIFCKNT